MSNILKQVKTELKQLPLILGKLLGGGAAVIGFAIAVLIITRKPDPTLADILPFLLAGCAGIVIFILSARVLNRRLSSNADEVSRPVDTNRTNMLSWGLLLLLAAIFLAGTYFMTK